VSESVTRHSTFLMSECGGLCLRLFHPTCCNGSPQRGSSVLRKHARARHAIGMVFYSGSYVRSERGRPSFHFENQIMDVAFDIFRRKRPAHIANAQTSCSTERADRATVAFHALDTFGVLYV